MCFSHPSPSRARVYTHTHTPFTRLASQTKTNEEKMTTTASSGTPAPQQQPEVVSARRALRDVEAVRRKVDSGAAAGDRAELERALALCEALERRLAAAVSANEELDDVPTMTLPLLRVEAQHAALELAVHTAPDDPAARLRQLEAARAHYAAFLASMRRLRIISPAEAASSDVPQDPGAARMAKIAAFKRRKEAKALVDTLEARRAANAKPRPRSEDDDDDAMAEDQENEEEARERWVAVLRLEALDAAEQLQMIAREAEMLSAVAAMKAAGTFEAQREKDRADREEALRRAGQRRPITILGTAAAQREAMRAGVFRPFHRQPTMMPEEAAELEMAEAQRAAAAVAPKPTPAQEDSDQETDASLARQRAWDDWKDTHPRGSGNTKGQG